MSLTNQGRQIKCYVAYRVRDCCYSRRRYCLVVGVVADVFFFFFLYLGCTWYPTKSSTTRDPSLVLVPN